MSYQRVYYGGEGESRGGVPPEFTGANSAAIEEWQPKRHVMEGLVNLAQFLSDKDVKALERIYIRTLRASLRRNEGRRPIGF